MHCVRHSARKFFISLYWSPVLISHKENLKLSEDGRRPPILSVMVISIIIFSKTTADPWSSGTFSTVLHVEFLRCAILLPYVLRSGHLRGDQLWYILPKGHIDIFFSKQALLPYCFPPTLLLSSYPHPENIWRNFLHNFCFLSRTGFFSCFHFRPGYKPWREV